jgi:hypothetical protein
MRDKDRSDEQKYTDYKQNKMIKDWTGGVVPVNFMNFKG